MAALTQMNLGDPELEVIDPTPNVHALFIHFDKIFFWTKLASRAVVRWSKRMYSCAGVCSYEGRGGLCDIALSEPLLKLRPRKDLVETLLHEMIHAFLFVTCRDQDRDGHGPNFQAHMHRINKSAGLNISIYHDFHDEVRLYQTHWWRCSGPCQKWKPYFGIVRRFVNKPPGPSDSWWNCHKRKCGGNFVKIKEPEKTMEKAATKPKQKSGDITKYINNKNVTNKSVLKDSNANILKTGTKSNSSSTVVISQKGSNNKNKPVEKKIITSPVLFSGKGVTLNDGRKRSNSVDVIETVRNVWANRTLNSTKVNKPPKSKQLVNKHDSRSTNSNKHKAESVHKDSPPAKIKKIDDYFKTAATVLKDIYGQDFNVTETKDKKIVATTASKADLVDCPICNAKVDSKEINRHLDECLNKDVIESLANNNAVVKPEPKEESNWIPFKVKSENVVQNEMVKKEVIASVDLTNIDFSIIPIKTEIKKELDFNRVNTADNIPKQEVNNIDDAKVTTLIIEPGTSKEVTEVMNKECAFCGNVVDKPIEQHLDECLALFDNNTTIAEEGASTSLASDTIVLDDDADDVFDDSMTMNATGTKMPCPCCMEMVETEEMNEHLDNCLI